ncbi:MAG: cytidine deaminase [Chloroflexi bacterium]|nr:cytidine deaminase [Chloroflexota bacterium]
MTNPECSPIKATWRALYEAACDAKKAAYVPYSRYAVGAAIEAAGGSVYGGCNVENASSGLTVCAERVAVWTAICDGARTFTRLALVTADGGTPCGACRQVLAEFAEDLEVLIADERGYGRLTTLAQLLPDAFKLTR